MQATRMERLDSLRHRHTSPAHECTQFRLVCLPPATALGEHRLHMPRDCRTKHLVCYRSDSQDCASGPSQLVALQPIRGELHRRNSEVLSDCLLPIVRIHGDRDPRRGALAIRAQSSLLVEANSAYGPTVPPDRRPALRPPLPLRLLVHTGVRARSAQRVRQLLHHSGHCVHLRAPASHRCALRTGARVLHSHHPEHENIRRAFRSHNELNNTNGSISATELQPISLRHRKISASLDAISRISQVTLKEAPRENLKGSVILLSSTASAANKSREFSKKLSLLHIAVPETSKTRSNEEARLRVNRRQHFGHSNLLMMLFMVRFAVLYLGAFFLTALLCWVIDLFEVNWTHLPSTHRHNSSHVLSSRGNVQLQPQPNSGYVLDCHCAMPDFAESMCDAGMFFATSCAVKHKRLMAGCMGKNQFNSRTHSKLTVYVRLSYSLIDTLIELIAAIIQIK